MSERSWIWMGGVVEESVGEEEEVCEEKDFSSLVRVDMAAVSLFL